MTPFATESRSRLSQCGLNCLLYCLFRFVMVSGLMQSAGSEGTGQSVPSARFVLYRFA